MEIKDDSRVEVFLKPDQVSLAIGKGGHNIKLASKLTEYEIDVYREGAEDIDDVDLDEFDKIRFIEDGQVVIEGNFKFLIKNSDKFYSYVNQNKA